MNNKKLYATIVCLIIALVATYLGAMQKVIGAPMIGLLIGMLVVNTMPSLDKEFKAVTSYVGKKFLNLGIVLTGATLNFNIILGYGAKAMPLLLANICIAFLASYIVGKKLEVSRNTSTLVASGTCICGGTAIATMSSVIGAKETEIAYAITAIFLFDVISALVYPYLATGLNLTINQFGFLAGASINDTSSVVAAESTYSVLNGIDSNLAITIKLARTTLLIILVVIFTILNIKNKSATNFDAESNEKLIKTLVDTFPKFILVFLLMAILNTVGLFDGISWVEGFFKTFSKFCIATALAGIGFKVRFKGLLTEGRNPIILGGITWLFLSISSMLFITIFANYVG
jgi:uncharacterized integral membrane protein (TIGR00698 family)